MSDGWTMVAATSEVTEDQPAAASADATSNIRTHGMAGSCAGFPVAIDLASYDVRIVDGMIEIRLRGAS